MPEKKPKEKKENTFFQDYQNLLISAKRLEKTAKNPFFKSNYVQLKDVLAEAKKLCVENNLIFLQIPKIREDGIAILETRLLHKTGFRLIAQTLLPCRDYNDPQKVGGAITYMRRYSLTAILGLEEEDDDGNNANKEKLAKQEPKPTSQADLVKIVLDKAGQTKQVGKIMEIDKRVMDSKLYTQESKKKIHEELNKIVDTLK